MERVLFQTCEQMFGFIDSLTYIVHNNEQNEWPFRVLFPMKIISWQRKELFSFFISPTKKKHFFVNQISFAGIQHKFRKNSFHVEKLLFFLSFKCSCLWQMMNVFKWWSKSYRDSFQWTWLWNINSNIFEKKNFFKLFILRKTRKLFNSFDNCERNVSSPSTELIQRILLFIHLFAMDSHFAYRIFQSCGNNSQNIFIFGLSTALELKREKPLISLMVFFKKKEKSLFREIRPLCHMRMVCVWFFSQFGSFSSCSVCCMHNNGWMNEQTKPVLKTDIRGGGSLLAQIWT